jgi:hypothetical protein
MTQHLEGLRPQVDLQVAGAQASSRQIERTAVKP